MEPNMQFQAGLRLGLWLMYSVVFYMLNAEHYIITLKTLEVFTYLITALDVFCWSFNFLL